MEKAAKPKHPGGRPRIYKSPEQMQEAIDDYFATTEIPTVCGLALHLGFNSRQSMFSYEGYSSKYLDTIKRAKARVERYLEESLQKQAAAGTIFNLKNNFGWVDKTEQDINLSGGVIFRENR